LKHVRCSVNYGYYDKGYYEKTVTDAYQRISKAEYCHYTITLNSEFLINNENRLASDIHYLASKEIKYLKTMRIIYYDENPVVSHASK
jgi:hypothetical protein